MALSHFRANGVHYRLPCEEPWSHWRSWDQPRSDLPNTNTLATKCSIQVQIHLDAKVGETPGPNDLNVAPLEPSIQTFFLSGLEKDVVHTLVWPKLVVRDPVGVVHRSTTLREVYNAWICDLDTTTM